MSISNKYVTRILKEGMSKIYNDPTSGGRGSQKDIEMLRTAVIAELDATNLYEQMAAQASSSDVRKLFLDIAKEEKVHIGEFRTVLEDLDSDYEEAEEEGEEEVEDMF